MNDAELNAILFYADYLSIKARNHPVTDNCKYYFIHGVPMNSSYVLDMEPNYDENDEYFQKAKSEYLLLRNKFGEDGVNSFIENICNLKASGTVNAIQILKYIHRYNTKIDKK